MTGIVDKIENPSLLPWGERMPESPQDMPEEAPEGYPTPWEYYDAGNGHFNVYDANERHLFHIHCWEKGDFEVLKQKIWTVNKTPMWKRHEHRPWESDILRAQTCIMEGAPSARVAFYLGSAIGGITADEQSLEYFVSALRWARACLKYLEEKAGA
jgi:hypothetical protein